jgi:hypothetical protein
MILPILAAALVLNFVGRFLILREDNTLDARWRRGLLLCPGAELVYLLLRWERARIGSIACGLSLAVALPLAGQYFGFFGAGHSGPNADLTKDGPAFAGSQKDLAKALQFKEEKVTKLTRYLQDWHQQLKGLEGYLCSEMPEETREFERRAASYEGLLHALKIEQHELSRMKAHN